MANYPIPLNNLSVTTTQALVETLQTPRLRAGGPSSSSLLNRLFSWVKNDLLRASVVVADTAENNRRLALLLLAQNAGLVAQYSALSTAIAALSPNVPNTLFAEFYSNVLTVQNSTLTSADINPLFGQAILQARSRQNVLFIENPGTDPPAIPANAAISFVMQPEVTSTLNATAPADYLFCQDLESVYAMDNNDLTAWIVEDPTQEGHMVWVEIDLPGNASGSYRCNELEFVPAVPFNTALVAVQANVIGSGWQDIDFSYLDSYDPDTNAVLRLGPSRLCFAASSISSFRLGLWVSGLWGFTHIRACYAVYDAGDTVTVDFSSLTRNTLATATLLGKDPGELANFAIDLSTLQVTVDMLPTGSSEETPVLTGISVTYTP